MKLGKGDDNAYGLLIFNADGKVRTALFGGDVGSGLNLSRAGGRPKMASFIATPNGGAYLGVRDEKGGVALVATKNGAEIQIRNAEDKIIFKAPQ
jgi:hypothetical protein